LASCFGRGRPPRGPPKTDSKEEAFDATLPAVEDRYFKLKQNRGEEGSAVW
jgi:hypothetical protein